MPALKSITPFPVEGLLPKETTQAKSFLEKFPKYDGRGVRVAILDTGVDPAAKGLEGRVVDVIDCTGSGDTPLEAVKPSQDAPSDKIGLKSPTTGRALLVSSSLTNPSGKWFVGTKPAYGFWPKDLIARRKSERRKEWDVEQEKLRARVQFELNQLSNGPAQGVTTGSESAEQTQTEDKDTKAKKNDLEAQQRASAKAELTAQLEVLKDLASTYSDPGPIIEVVAWHDGKNWRAVVEGAEGSAWDPSQGLHPDRLKKLEDSTLDFSARPALTDFHKERQHDTFGQIDLLTYSVNFLFEIPPPENEQVKGDAHAPSGISLCVVSGSHGTHVAGIVGAKRDDDPEQNGGAPGCELVSLMIGDARLGSMETQKALVRAARAIIDTGCAVANMSFGESGAWGVDNKGLFAEQLRDIVIREHDCLFVSSAGNSGPALSTLGQPAGTTSGVITVGAYVDAGSMLKAEYALLEDGIKSSTTTWCSRGPVADGDLGVDTYAPGAAITCIPRYCLQSTMLANGTSMASPSAAGALSLIVSGLLAEGTKFSAARITKALRGSNKDVRDDLGVGFIQVAKLWSHLQDLKDDPVADAEWRVAVTPAGKPPGRAGTDQRGIYLRDEAQTQGLSQFTLTATPTFGPRETQRSYELQVPAAIVSTAPWVTTTEHVWIGSKGRGFEVRVDCSDLEAGKLHTARVEAWDTNTGRLLFDAPVTVTKPLPPNPTVVLDKVKLDHGKVDRRFVSVPAGATWAELSFRSANHQVSGTSVRFWYHGVQVLPHARLPDAEQAYVLALNEGEPVTKKFPIVGGHTLEMCLAQFWSSAAGFDLDIKIEFHGVNFGAAKTPGRDETTLVGGQGIARLSCTSNVRIETFKPSLSFNKVRTFVRPTAFELRPLLAAPRDTLPAGGQINELVLTYPLEIKEEKAKVSYAVPLFNHLYDSAVPMLSQLFDGNKTRVEFNDVYSGSKTVELMKGNYTLQVELLNPDVKVLEKLKNATLRVDTNLGKDVSLDLYEDHVDLFGSAKPSTFSNIKLLRGERKLLVIDTNLEGDAVPKGAEPGDILIGHVTANGGCEGRSGELRLVVPPTAKKQQPDEGVKLSTEKKLPELLAGLLEKTPEAEKEAFADRLLKDYPDNLAVLVARLKAISKPDEKENSPKLLEAARLIFNNINENEVLLHIGSKKVPVAERTKEEKEQIKELDEKKDAYILALNRQTRALLAQSAERPSAEFESAFAQYRRVADEKDSAFAVVATSWHAGHKRYGKALQLLRKAIKDFGAGTSSNLEELNKARELERTYLQALNWTLWSANADRFKALQNPKIYSGF
ncbi:Tripeptidyl peptidase II [Ceraceosorus bombacis]|uniref:tripeptidyl-peptidase II n=1 Tax=Ceraceosorus bombacis TaxID=401625 RepID=A0A0P1BC73_9BASI|nr:Tripeptidyl peptidase II [Ceraceosorus bombacis]